MPHASPRASSLRRALVPALALCLLPLGTAFAQSYQQVRVLRDDTEINSLRQADDVKMRAPKGTVLEVIYIEGDRYAHRKSNWYWVLLPRDPWATRPAGWIKGNDIEHVAPVAAPAHAMIDAAPPAAASAAGAAVVDEARPTAAAAAPVTVDRAPVARPVFADVVLNFQFGKSQLTEEAKRKLEGAIALPKPNAQLRVALEGHADWVGSEGYNQQLGLDRAEAVRRYLSERLHIPSDRIDVISFGENDPAATNSTREGRALNRRVVIKVGA